MSKAYANAVYVQQEDQAAGLPTATATPVLSQPLLAPERSPPPPAVPYGHNTTVIIEETEVEEPYCGPFSCFFAVVLAFVFWPAALCVPCCPCDTRRVPAEIRHVVRTG